jgi:hypothetical protein
MIAAISTETISAASFSRSSTTPARDHGAGPRTIDQLVPHMSVPDLC